MLGEKYELELTYGDDVYNLSFSFGFLKNLYTLIQYSPLQYLKEFLGSKESDRAEYLINIIYAMTDGKINYRELFEIVTNPKNSELMISIAALVLTDMSEEDIFDKEEVDSDDNREDKDESLQDFIKFWDTNYYIAQYQLHMGYKKFLGISPRELRTLAHIHRDFIKGILLEKEIDMLKANSNVKSEKENVKVNRVNRIEDLF